MGLKVPNHHSIDFQESRQHLFPHLSKPHEVYHYTICNPSTVSAVPGVSTDDLCHKFRPSIIMLSYPIHIHPSQHYLWNSQHFTFQEKSQCSIGRSCLFFIRTLPKQWSISKSIGWRTSTTNRNVLRNNQNKLPTPKLIWTYPINT